MKCLVMSAVAAMMWLQQAHAAELDLTMKAKLQSVMIEFLDEGSDASGSFKIIDRETGALLSVFPGALHPKIVPFGADYVLCLEMYDADGTKYDADLIVREGSMGWQVVDVLFDQRPLLKKALAQVD